MKPEQSVIKSLPRHVAIIMDGNGTWARRRGLPRNFGHRQGARTLKNIVLFASRIGIEYLTVFAFSTENWSRPQEEVDFLMNLPTEFMKANADEIRKNDIRFLCVGDRTRLPVELQETIDKHEKETAQHKGMSFIVALNYGGKDEIVRAVNRIIASDVPEVDAEKFSCYLDTKDIPDIDLLIRTSGQQRISNFILWKLAYSELYFTKTLWPDFNEKHFIKALKDYSKRERRYGGIK
ncbi:MAG TPA: isoprenyl transferase [Acholeplasmataceae bacterium]|nr:isoprenyl transferase [Acholeplasmataceae bacterium]